MGRPSSYNDEMAEKVLCELAKVGSLRRVCRNDWAPDRDTVMKWVVENINDFSAKYAHAKSRGIDEFIEETLDIADDGENDWMASNKPGNEGYDFNGEHVQRSKIRIETRRWLAERMEPKKYGVLIKQELTGKDGGAIEVDEVKRGARVSQLLELAKARLSKPQE